MPLPNTYDQSLQEAGYVVAPIDSENSRMGDLSMPTAVSSDLSQSARLVDSAALDASTPGPDSMASTSSSATSTTSMSSS